MRHDDGYEIKIAVFLYVKLYGNVTNVNIPANWTPLFIIRYRKSLIKILILKLWPKMYFP